MRQNTFIISITGLSLLLLGMERTIGCILGSALGVIITGFMKTDNWKMQKHDDSATTQKSR